MRHGPQQFAVFEPWRLRAQKMTHDGVNGGFVENDEILEPVAELVRDERAVIREALRRVPRRPAAFFEQGLRQVPMEQGRIRFDVLRQQRVDKAAIVIEAFLVHRARTFRQHARPGDRKAIGA